MSFNPFKQKVIAVEKVLQDRKKDNASVGRCCEK